MTTFAITMAGRGQRFRDAGYDMPKFMIEVRGRTLFDWALTSLEAWFATAPRMVFIARAEDAASEFITARCAALGLTDTEVIELDATTDGQATSAKLAAGAVRRPADPFAVYNIDTHVRPAAVGHLDVQGDGWLPCFPAAGSALSFARTDATGKVVELREKERISPHATVGLYWFRSLELYEQLYRTHYGEHGVDAAGERYIAPMYNSMIAGGADVRISELALEDVVPLGTPDEVRAFAVG